MLAHLHVKNLALIEEIEVEFGPGLNILTGETGAGKSILLGSMQLNPGWQKLLKNMIRAKCILCTCGAAFSGRKRESAGDTESTGYLSGRWTGTSVQEKSWMEEASTRLMERQVL